MSPSQSTERERCFLNGTSERPGFWVVSRYVDMDCIEGIYPTRSRAASVVPSVIEFRGDQNEAPHVLVEDHR